MQTELENPTARTLTERIADAPPQELVALLLEGARGFTAKAMVAIQQRDLPAKARLVGRVSAIIEQLLVMLNFEEGGEVVSNLSRIYEWWLKELLDASCHDAVDRLQRICTQMGSMQESWQQG